MSLVWSSSDLDLNGLAAFRVEHRQDRAVLFASGEIDLLTAPALREAVLAATRVSDDIVIDLTAVTFIDSTGIGVLVRAGRSGQNVVALVGPTLMVRKVLHLTGLDQVFPVFATIEEALSHSTSTSDQA
jgi:anti-anti-sigma factor